ncbi:hypothetical protein D3C85_593800 [compost metagenome]
MCGVRITLGMPISGLASGSSALLGSVGNTSSAAPARWPDFSAACSAEISTTVPREALIRMAPRRMRAMVSAFMMFSVDLPPGTCSVTTSACSSRSFSVPAGRALPSGSLASTS